MFNQVKHLQHFSGLYLFLLLLFFYYKHRFLSLVNNGKEKKGFKINNVNLDVAVAA